MSVSVVLLAYSEAENLKILLPQINGILSAMNEDFEILVVDSAQPTDNTREICGLYHASYIPQEEPHYGGAFRTGNRYATKGSILYLDADGSHDPAAIPAIFQKFSQGYDVVIGSRYTKGGVTLDSKSSLIMSKILNTSMRFCLGIRARDISTSYRLYNARQLKAVRLTRENYDVLQEVLLRMKLINRKLKIAEVPITFRKRLAGQSKRRLFRFICGYVVSLVTLSAINLRAKLASYKKDESESAS
jgi:dolichol-phosphate mannosyltransferase